MDSTLSDALIEFAVSITNDDRNLEQIIADRLKVLGISHISFARDVAKEASCNPETIMRFLRGTHDTSVSNLESMLICLHALVVKANSIS